VFVPGPPDEAAWAACGSAVVVLFGMPPTVSDTIPAWEEEKPEFDILVFWCFGLEIMLVCDIEWNLLSELFVIYEKKNLNLKSCFVLVFWLGDYVGL